MTVSTVIQQPISTEFAHIINTTFAEADYVQFLQSYTISGPAIAFTTFI